MKTTAHTFLANLFASRALRRGACVLLACGMAQVAIAQSVVVPTIMVQTSQTGASYELDALIEPVKQSTVSAQASGRITAMKVKAGDPVRKGQLLTTIDDQEASVGMQRSQAQINQADAELRNAQAQWERTKDLQSRARRGQCPTPKRPSATRTGQCGRQAVWLGARLYQSAGPV